MHRFFLAAFFAAFPIAAVAMTTLAPSTVAGAPATYDGQTIRVAGTVQNVKSRNTEALGEVTAFQLCDTRCIHVLDKTNQTRSDGASATVTGTFHETFKAPKKTWNNVLIIGG
ncbi:MAG TPA: hypothetical protein VGI19_00445 [Candidatus Cybelea sp.]